MGLFLHKNAFCIIIMRYYGRVISLSILDDRILASVSSEQLLPLPKTCFTYEQMKMKLVKSQEGDILGMLEDVYFCLDRGIIVAYELSDGFFSDLAGSKRQIQRADSLVEVRKDEIVLNG